MGKNRNNKSNNENKQIVQENNTSGATEIKEKKKLLLKDEVMLNVESTIFGKLIYKNHTTGDKTTWLFDGDIQQLTVGNIRAIKSNQIKFFKRNWIRIVGFAEEGFEDYTVDDIYKCLLLDAFIENSKINVEDIILNHSDKIKEYVEKLGQSFRTMLIIKSNDLIISGKLDSFSLIKKLEKILETDLVDID